MKDVPNCRASICAAILKLQSATSKKATLLHPPLPVFAQAHILLHFLSLFVLSLGYTEESQRDEPVAGSVAAV